MAKGAATARIIESFTEFGPFLRYLRRRVRLTQRELGIAVGYSTPQISLLENGQRLPDLTTLAALFIPALSLEEEPDLAARLLELAAAAHGQSNSLPLTRTIRRPITITATTETTIALLANSQAKRPPPNLPAPVWPLIGREGELESARSLLLSPSSRLLTLIGPPGVGKTRLALQLAWENDAAFADGARFVELAAIQEPALVPPALMQALEISEIIGDGPGAALKPLRDYLRDKRLFLVLDNFEQLLPAASLVAELLAAAPYLKILVTSRTPLHLYGEHEFSVAPLALPDLARLPSPDKFTHFPAIALFVARAQAVQPNFALTAENALAVAAICAQLDGLPLAIELAAAQSKRFTPQELAVRLAYKNSPARHDSTGLKVLAFGWHNLPPRHQTLTNAIDWSYQLLEPDEQELFRQLGVFRGGFTLAAVEAICTELQLHTGAGSIVNRQANSVNMGLTSLADKSLIQPDKGEGESRFTMLETLREYALAQLAACEKLEATRRRHAEFFIALAEQAEPQLMAAEQKVWFERLERERDNFNAALFWAFEASVSTVSEASPHELGLRLCVALWRFWRYRCYLAEGYFWTQRALLADQNSLHPAPRLLRARALWGLGLISTLMYKEKEATAYLAESLSLAQAEEDPGWIAAALTGLGMLANNRGDSEQAIVFQEQALALYQSQHDVYGMTYAQNALGETFCGRGDYEASRNHYEASLKLSRQLGHRRGVAVALANIAQIETAQGNYAAAQDGFAESLRLFQEIGDQVNMATCLMGLGCVATAANIPIGWTQAARLFGFGHHLLRQINGKLQPADQLQVDRYIALCRQQLGDTAFKTARAEGEALSLEQAVMYALTQDLIAGHLKSF